MQANIQNGRIIRISERKPLDIISAGVRTFVRKHYIVSGLYVVGLLVALLGTGISVTQQDRNLYERRLAEASTITSTEITGLLIKLRKADDLYYQHKGWFSCDEVCTMYYNRTQAIRHQLQETRNRRDAVMKEGKQAVGAWSVYGISDLRSAFWEAWEEGKEAARRMTMLDAVFIGMGSMFGSNSNRDDSFIILILRVLFQFLANLTIGLVTSVVVFMVEAWYIISSYGPSLLSGLALFMISTTASVSVVTTAIGGIVGGTVGGVYLLAKNAERRYIEEARSQRQHLHYD